jgi:hypothetical protein
MSDYPPRSVRYAPLPTSGETFPVLRSMLRTLFEAHFGADYRVYVLPEAEHVFPPDAAALEAIAASLPPDTRTEFALAGRDAATSLSEHDADSLAMFFEDVLEDRRGEFLRPVVSAPLAYDPETDPGALSLAADLAVFLALRPLGAAY